MWANVVVLILAAASMLGYMICAVQILTMMRKGGCSTELMLSLFLLACATIITLLLAGVLICPV